MKARQSDQPPASLARVQGTERYYFITTSPWGGDALARGPSAHDWVLPLPFSAVGIRGRRKCQTDVTHQVCDTPHTAHFLPVGPPFNSGWFWNGSSLRVSQSCQSPPPSPASSDSTEPIHSHRGRGGRAPTFSPQTKAVFAYATSLKMYLGPYSDFKGGMGKLRTGALGRKLNWWGEGLCRVYVPHRHWWVRNPSAESSLPGRSTGQDV